ncbi:cyclic nucleotide-binding domain-containing thioredoxin-disulfide reductase [Agromyces sp. Soil535]|uniref:FAD-dependent oxidoreductase n=1 Tax=Agromyces sp. Soil535 TaxID=1736390 RepID=UPI0006F43E85|nr:cyclic nucleotide-binding domain-containing thioredoxin-disulfide reductase [Agromyces sp. Soil535]KRE29097.1 pyridine nucleotide-disulfide oxidoreductase [Agromyces sp. Soil535]
MITVEGLRAIPIFAPLPSEPLEYLARAVEDIHLLPGEYFSHEGDERALFVVVEGHAEITKVVNGEERVIGVRKPGQFFGEVPMTLSTPFPASGRAAEATRIIKLDVTVYYTLAAMAPSVPTRVAGLAGRYLDSLQAIAAEQPETEVRVVGPRLDARVHRVAGFLTRNQVAFDRVTLDAADDGRVYPILELPDGARLVGPSMREVAIAVGLDVEPAGAEYDVVILGGGPAGLTAAVNGAAEGLRTVVIESLAPGGQAGTSTRIENYTGFPFGISGDDLASRALKQAKRLGAEIVVTRTVEALRPDRREIVLDGGETLVAPTVIVATGVEWRTLPVPRVERHLGNGVYYGAARSDAAVAQGQDVCIIGAGNSAGQAALFFSRRARSVTMLVRGESLGSSMSRYLIDQIAANDGIRVETRSEVVALHGETSLEGVDVIDKATGRTTRRPYTVVFVMIGADAVTGWLPPDIARDAHGFILTGADAAATAAWTADRRPFALETSAPGIFAVGDVRSGSVKRVAAGVGEGGMAIAFVHQYLALPQRALQADTMDADDPGGAGNGGSG